MENIKIGDIVQAEYNTGIYIGKVIEDRRNFFLVQVHAVIKHPIQGDLHNRGKVEGVAFHERKALAYNEKMNAKKRKVQPYHGTIPDYSISLKNAVEAFKQELKKLDTDYHRLSLQKLHDLENDFYKKIYNE